MSNDNELVIKEFTQSGQLDALTVNPDGVIYHETTYPNGGGMWRKNRRDHFNGDHGVDNNNHLQFFFL